MHLGVPAIYILKININIKRVHQDFVKNLHQYLGPRVYVDRSVHIDNGQRQNRMNLYMAKKSLEKESNKVNQQCLHGRKEVGAEACN